MVKRALLYVRRRYKYSFVLFLLIVIIATSLLMGVSMHSAIKTTTKELQQNLGTSFVFKAKIDENNSTLFETQKFDNGLQAIVYTGPTVNQDLINKILCIDGVKEYNAENYVPAYIESTALIGGLWEYSLNMALTAPGYLESGTISLEEHQLWSSTGLLYGNTNTALYDKFRTNAFELIEGRHIQAGDTGKVLLSSALCKKNGLKIGDKIRVSVNEFLLMGGDAKKQVGAPTDLEIVGIYQVNGYQPVNENVAEVDIVDNWLLTDNQTVYALTLHNQNSSAMPFENATFFVDSPSILASIVEEARKIGDIDTNYYDITIDDTAYRATLEPLNVMKTMVFVIAILVSGCCIIILGIVFRMNIKGRTREFGIYLSLGIGKMNILMQVVFEALIVASFALILCFASTPSLVKAFGESIVASAQNDVVAQHDIGTEEWLAALDEGDTSAFFELEHINSGVSNVHFSVGILNCIVVGAIVLLSIIGSILIACRFILHYSPKMIFTEYS